MAKKKGFGFKKKTPTEKLMDKAMEQIKSVGYQVSLRWLFYRLLQNGSIAELYPRKVGEIDTKYKSRTYSNFKSLQARYRRGHKRGWEWTTLKDGTRRILWYGIGAKDYGEWIERLDTFLGDGYNMTSGGEHYILSNEVRENISRKLKGYIHTSETRQNMSKAQRGRKLSEEHKANIGKSSKGRTCWTKGKPLSDEHKANILSGYNRFCKVKQLDKVSGEILDVFDSIKDAHMITGTNRGHITSVCKGNRKSAGGFIWRYI